MKVAVLSGKGGTGKTLVSTNLAASVNNSVYLDCDVEEPNGHLFFKPQKNKSTEITLKIPIINHDLCNLCRKCVNFCQFSALAMVNNKVVVFEEMCHACGGCTYLCPENAISEKDKVIGKVKTGLSENVEISTGFLNTNEASGVAIIEHILRKYKKDERAIFIDCPPGSACVVMESIKDADFCILVAEPTAFGLANLEMVYELVKLFKKPFGIVINKVEDKNNLISDFCKKEDIEILEQILFDKELGRINASANLIVREDKDYKEMFQKLFKKIEAKI